jgi:hypothetical protein
MKSATAAAFAVSLLSLPGTAAACGACALGIYDYFLPHILAWCLGMTVWFLMLTVIGATEEGLALSSDPARHVFMVLASVALAFFFGAAFLGPLPFFLLGLISLAVTGKGFSPKVWPDLSRNSQLGLKAVSALVVVCTLAGLAISMHTKRNRSDVQFILQWSGTYQSITLLKQLLSRPQEHEVQLRELLAKTKNQDIAGQVSEALATIQQKKPAADGE